MSLNSKHVFGALIVILVASLAVNLYSFTGFRTDTENRLQNQIGYVQNQLETSSTQLSDLQKENMDLQQQLTEARAPKPYLVTRLGWYLHPDRLYIGGEITNVGDKTATNCSLHVTLYRNKTVVEDVYLPLGDGVIQYWSHENVYENIRYTGGLLTNWTITPEWSS
jgi:hypothetical protein